MKKKTDKGKLTLKKEFVANLTNSEMNSLKGGDITDSVQCTFQYNTCGCGTDETNDYCDGSDNCNGGGGGGGGAGGHSAGCTEHEGTMCVSEDACTDNWTQ